MSKEKVLVTPLSLLKQIGIFQGVSEKPSKYINCFFSQGNTFFLPREEVEENQNYKQIISYAIFRKGEKYLCYTRNKSGGESRLHAKMSLGIGGHINPEDIGNLEVEKEVYEAAVKREIKEEISIQGDYKGEVIGLLNDDSTEVGKVHIGIIHLFNLSSEKVTSNEEAISSLRFISLSELKKKYFHSLETWSQLCVDFLIKRKD